MAISLSFGTADPIIDVEVRDSGAIVTATGLLDSGSEMSGISSTIVTRLGLTRVGSVSLAGTTGALVVDTYAVDLHFPQPGLTRTISTVRVFEIQGALGADVVIGRDLICHTTSSSQLSLAAGGTGTFDL